MYVHLGTCVCITCIWNYVTFQLIHYSRLSVSVCKGGGLGIVKIGTFMEKGVIWTQKGLNGDDPVTPPHVMYYPWITFKTYFTLCACLERVLWS